MAHTLAKFYSGGVRRDPPSLSRAVRRANITGGAGSGRSSGRRHTYGVVGDTKMEEDDRSWWEDDGDMECDGVVGAATSSATVIVNGGDILDACADRLGIARSDRGSGYVKPLIPYDQKDTKQCMAASACMAMYLAALLRADDADLIKLRNSKSHFPSVTYAYYKQRQLECRETGRVKCGAMCGGDCEDLGSVMFYMIRTLKAGVVLEEFWPRVRSHDDDMISKANDNGFLPGTPRFVLSGCYKVTPAMKKDAVLEIFRGSIDRGQPVVINMIGYGNQNAFANRQKDERAGASWTDEKHRMPPPDPSTRLSSGHAVTLVGYDNSKRLLRIRNSSSDKWGYHGDFALSYDYFGSEHKESGTKQMYGALVITEVKLEGIR